MKYANLPNYAVIIRAIHQRGNDQKLALAELERRGLWLSAEQQITSARIDAKGRYCDDANAAMKAEIEKGGVNHIAFLVGAESD